MKIFNLPQQHKIREYPMVLPCLNLNCKKRVSGKDWVRLRKITITGRISQRKAGSLRPVIIILQSRTNMNQFITIRNMSNFSIGLAISSKMKIMELRQRKEKEDSVQKKKDLTLLSVIAIG